MPAKILIFGKDGQLGQTLRATLLPLGAIIPLGRAEADFLKPDQIIAKLDELNPDVVINAAAWNQVDLAESRPDEARLVNAASPGAIARWAQKNNAFL